MISRSRAALIFSAVILLAAAAHAERRPIGTVGYTGAGAVPASALYSGSLLPVGVAFSDSLLELELLRIDSLYFAAGMLEAQVTVDTLALPDRIDVSIGIDEGEHTRIGSVKVTGSTEMSDDRIRGMLQLGEGDLFYPVNIEIGLSNLLAAYNASGYPYAQVWLTGFDYDRARNEVTVTISLFEGERSRLSRVEFEGLTKTDSAFAIKVTRLKTGAQYDEGAVRRAKAYLNSSGIFSRVGEPVIVQVGRGDVAVRYPVEEAEKSNTFQGALGVGQRGGDDYVLNGAVDLELRHIGGTGRDVHFDWLDNGESYSRLGISYHEPFLLGSRLALDAEVGQVIQDSVYVYHSGGLYFGLPLGPEFVLTAGAAADRNVPEQGQLIRSIRQRYRLGIEKKAGLSLRFSFHVEGGSRKSYYETQPDKRGAQFLYALDGSLTLPLFDTMAIYVRLASRAVFSRESIQAAELYTIGGARSLRGYRESQFRGERIAFANVEYWFSRGGAFYLFDDIGTFFTAEEGWVVKNGLGFGLRSESPVGTLSLSFGLGDEISLRATKVHVALQERF